jgi:hypothetical protein
MLLSERCCPRAILVSEVTREHQETVIDTMHEEAPAAPAIAEVPVKHSLEEVPVPITFHFVAVQRAGVFW